MNQISYILESGSSPDGHHAIESFLACPRRARLDAELKAKWLASTMPLALDNSSYSIGTLFHAFQDLYCSGQIVAAKDMDEVEFTSDDGRQVQIDYEALLEAKRMSAAWMSVFPPTLLGQTLETEFKLPASEAITTAVGRPKFSGRIDLVTKLSKGGAGKLADLTERFAGHRLELDPGLYLWDWKTSAAQYGSLGDAHGNSLQMIGYMAAWNALFPKQQLTGGGIVVAVKTKVPKFIFIRRGPPTKNELEALRRRHATEASMRASPELRDAAMPGCCFPFIMKPCAHWISGACKRA